MNRFAAFNPQSLVFFFPFFFLSFFPQLENKRRSVSSATMRACKSTLFPSPSPFLLRATIVLFTAFAGVNAIYTKMKKKKGWEGSRGGLEGEREREKARS